MKDDHEDHKKHQKSEGQENDHKPLEQSKQKGAPSVPDEIAKKLGTQHESSQDDQAAKQDATDGQDSRGEADDLADEKTDAAVEDIIKSDSDELLEIEDKAAKVQNAPKPKRWYKRAWFWWTATIVVVAGLFAAGGVPASRYWVLNTAGLRVQSSVEVLDRSTGQPLKNVEVAFGQSKARTDSKGKAKVTGLKLGPHRLKVSRIGFAAINRDVVLGWGSNPLGTFRMEATGIQLSLSAHDYLSGKPIEGAEASSGQAVARANEKGEIVLTLPGTTDAEAEVTLSAAGYRTENITAKANEETATAVALVPSRKAVFVSKEGNIYDVLTMDIDGQNKRVLLAGTGRENANIALSVSPDGARAALVSTRDDVRNKDGSLQETLTIITLSDGTVTTPDRGVHIQLMDWSGTRLVYQVIGDVPPSDNNRQRVISYDYKDNSRAQLATAGEIKSAASALGALYYPSEAGGLVKISKDGTSKQTLIDKPVEAIYRTEYRALSVQTSDGWYRVDLNSGNAAATGEPASFISRTYIDNAAGTRSLWAAQATLHLYDAPSSKERELQTTSGLTYPLRWLNDEVVLYRIATNQEIADYAVSINGGEPIIVAPVTATLAPTQSY